MIKKLDLLNNTTHVFNDESYLVNVAVGKGTIIKINELVDAVNNIQKERDAERFEIQEWIGILEAVRKSVNVHEKQIDELQMKLEPEKCEIPVDKFTEQRRWIGKLCRFRDEYYKDGEWDYGLLQDVENPLTAHIWKTGCFKHNLGRWYDYCEPVKQDDDIIYKEKNKFTYQEIIIGDINENKEK